VAQGFKSSLFKRGLTNGLSFMCINDLDSIDFVSWRKMIMGQRFRLPVSSIAHHCLRCSSTGGQPGKPQPPLYEQYLGASEVEKIQQICTYLEQSARGGARSSFDMRKRQDRR
jgi:hypothetical protein